jgi:hypothetical protein
MQYVNGDYSAAEYKRDWYCGFAAEKHVVVNYEFTLQ